MQRANAFDTKVFGGRIELADQLVDNFDQFVTRQAAGNLVDTQDVGKQTGR